MKTGMPYIETIVDYTSDLYCVWGRVDKPNEPITLILWRGRDSLLSSSKPAD